jgi:hypothetical protein
MIIPASALKFNVMLARDNHDLFLKKYPAILPEGMRQTARRLSNDCLFLLRFELGTSRMEDQII